jgi:RyR domain
MKRGGGKLDEAGIARIAEVMHEAMRVWQKTNGQTPSPPWSRAPKWMKESSAASVVWRIANPGAPTSAQHDQWLQQKKADGWKFGKTKDAVKKTHPMMIPYAQLPEFEKRKDALVNAVIDALK